MIKKLLLFVFMISFLFATEFVDYTSVFLKMHTEDKYISSSFLIDNKYEKNKYSPDKAFDGKENTAWVVSSNNSGIQEYIFFQIDFSSYKENQFPKKSKIRIKNGLFTSINLYDANNRVKRARFEIYECDLKFGQEGRTLYNPPVLTKIMEFDFKDEMVEQEFDIIISTPKPVANVEYHIYRYFGKLIITDIYKGSKYNDTCISEIETESFE